MERDFIITNEHGIHARPATTLVQHANKYNSDITATCGDVTIDLKSIMGLLSLGVARGNLVRIRINGPDQAEAMKDLSEVIKDINKGD